jgi:hypothetical protein
LQLLWLILCFNRRSYREALHHQNIQHSLTERYQRSENIRTSRQLLPIIFLHLLQNIPPTIYFLLAMDGFMNTPDDFLKLSTFTRFAIFELYLFLQLFIITYHPMLRRNAAASIKTRLPCYGRGRGNRVACDEFRGRGGWD